MRRRVFLSGMIGATAALPACANAPERSVRPAAKPADYAGRAAPGARALVASAQLGGKVGFMVADARTGRVLEAESPLLPLPPASVTKAVTALYGLETIGPAHRFRTQVLANGTLRNGRLDGDLILAGGGDPTLNTDDLAGLAAQVKAAGVREVTGGLRVYGGAVPQLDRIDREQPDHVGYNPAISGLNLNFNRLYFEWKQQGSEYLVSMDARSDRLRPVVDVARMDIVNRDLPVYTYALRNGREQWSVARTALGNGGGRWLPVRQPALYAGDVFRTLLRAHGIVVGPAAVIATVPVAPAIATHRSEDLAEVTRSMLKYSTNLTAELVGLTATMARSGTPGSLRASGDAMSDWIVAQSTARRPDFDDHSGLGASSRISAADMVHVLRSAGRNSPLRGLMKEMRIGKNDPILVQAKTGTLNFVSGLAGYFKTRSGRELVFATFAGDVARRNRLSLREREAPQGGRGWTRRARSLQFDLIERWSDLYG